IQLHNANSGSSDLTLIPYLTLGYGANPPANASVPAEIEASLDLPLHTNFRLSADGEELHLISPAGAVLDSIRFGSLPADVSLGRDPDGGPTWRYFAEPSPGAPNGGTTYQGVAPAVHFDPPGGIYPAGVNLTMSSDLAGAPIHCTLDGSTPTEESSLCSGSLSISGVAVVRARVIQPGLLPGPVVTHTYVDARHDLPVVSVVTDPPNLWDYNSGIYVMGPNAEPQNPHFGANFWQDWEVQANVELYEPGGAGGFNYPAGVSIMGGWSRAFAQKSLAFYARTRYGAEAFDYPLFPNRPYESYQSFALRNSGNDWPSTMLRDAFMQELPRSPAVDKLAYRPVVVYLNGEYWGIQNLREKISEHYVASISGAPADEVDLLELDGVVLNGYAEHFQSLMDLVTTADVTSEAVYDQIESMMDIENYIDYQIVQIFVDNTDWPGNNLKYWRHQTPSGKWRWILFDLDFGFGMYGASNYTNNTIAFAAEPYGPEWPNPPWSTLLFRRLLLNGEFRTAFVNRLADYLNVDFEPTRIQTVLDSLINNISNEMPRHLQRWGFTEQGWLYGLSVVSNFGRYREASIESHLRSFFGVGARVPVTVRVEPEGAGSILVNREIVSSTPWSGDYFSGVPLTLTALPRAGYRFVGWSGGAQTETAEVSVIPLRSIELVATFEETSLPQIVINEIHYHPADVSPSGDWIELWNGGGDADLSGWVLEDGGGNRFVMPAAVSLPSGEYLVVAEDPVSFSSVYTDVPGVTGGWTFGLSNAGESIRLLDAGIGLVDQVVFDDAAPWPVAADGQGPSLELLSGTLDNADPSNWRASSVSGGTPGRANSVFVGAPSEDLIPTVDVLRPAYPNPFRVRTHIPFELAAEGRVEVTIYNTIGQRVATLVDGRFSSGRHQLIWTGGSAPAGLYVVQLSVDGEARSRTVILRAK
ncbi:MAG: CotH kinase family protein, partial [Rhodothermales bacterium]|nr:CotH kinase family protein [Rhodothermales bacterium]